MSAQNAAPSKENPGKNGSGKKNSVPAAPSKGAVYFQALRAFSFPASMIPCLLGAMLALLMGVNVSWWLMPFIALSLLLLHAASNVTTDYDDYNQGVDREGTLGGSRVLVQKLLQPKQM